MTACTMPDVAYSPDWFCPICHSAWTGGSVCIICHITAVPARLTKRTREAFALIRERFWTDFNAPADPTN